MTQISCTFIMARKDLIKYPGVNFTLESMAAVFNNAKSMEKKFKIANIQNIHLFL